MVRNVHVLYHELRPEPSGYSYVTLCDEFRSHCQLFRKLLATPGTAAYRPEITFDDGHCSDHSYALPILQEHGLRGRFFVTVGWTGRNRNYLNWPDLRDLVQAGQTIGAHGWSHKLLTHCSDAELQAELVTPRRLLEDKLGVAVTTMSLPGGRADARVLQACREAGYQHVFTSVPKAEVVGAQGFLVGRLNLQGGTDVAWLERVFQPESGVLNRLHRMDRVKTGAKAVLGDKLYAGLWSVVNRGKADPADAKMPSA